MTWVGSGMSLPAGYRGWIDTILDLCCVCHVEPLRVANPPASILIAKAEECKKRDQNAYESKLAELFGGPVVQTRMAYHWLVSIPFKGFVTSNVDPLLSEAGKTRGLMSQAYPILSSSVLEKYPRTISYIHGLARWEDQPHGNNLVFAQSEFEKAYDGPVRSFIEQLLLYHNVLFLSCSLTEPSMEEVFRRVRDIIEDIESTGFSGWRRPSRYALLPFQFHVVRESTGAGTIRRNEAGEHDEEERFAGLGVEVVRYDPKDEQHSGMENILSQLAARPVQPTEPLMEPDIFRHE